MKVLMMTPTVDPLDPLQGSADTWVKRIAQQVDMLYVITLRQRNVAPDSKIKLYSLDIKSGRLSKLLYVYGLLTRLVPQVDLVFTHMYPIFPILVWPFTFLWRKPLVMWRCHNGHISLMTRIGHALVNRVVTASKESFRIRSQKVRIIGHGIDTERFALRASPGAKDSLTILSVGRISPVKDYETLIEAAHLLINEYGLKSTRFSIVGGPASTSEELYLNKVKTLTRERNLEEHFKFVGAVPYNRVSEFYYQSDLFVSTSHTGSIDKAVLEAMACGNLPVTCNEAFFPFLGSYGSALTFRKRDPQDLARKMADLHLMPEDDKAKIRSFLRKMVETEHSLDAWLLRLISVFQEMTGRH